MCVSKQSLSLLSFDLDDTFWPTTDVVHHANAKMIQSLHDRGCKDADIDSFLDNTRAIRKQLDAPVTYQTLRKLAIRKTLEISLAFENEIQELSLEQSHLADIVEECYMAWEQERHRAAERFLFEGAVETMALLRQKYPDTCFAAITNGAGDPLAMTQTLAPFFDFRISGEDDGVFPYRKPHPFIYEKTIETMNERNSQCDDEGAIWCHVGDCLANDVGASADCGAKAIWVCSEDNEGSSASRLNGNAPKWSTATAEEIEKWTRQVQDGRSKVAASITSLSELPDAIASILQHA
jgi:FMN phosphatase YigB (HAD superfamily)